MKSGSADQRYHEKTINLDQNEFKTVATIHNIDMQGNKQDQLTFSYYNHYYIRLNVQPV